MTDVAVVSPPSADEKTSATLRRVLQKLEGEEVRIGMKLYQLRRRSFGGVFIILAALSLLPGIAIFAGIMMTIPALQMAAGVRSPLLPRSPLPFTNLLPAAAVLFIALGLLERDGVLIFIGLETALERGCAAS